MRKRNIAVTIRMNEEEYRTLDRRLKETGLPQQTFLLSAIHGTDVMPPETRNEICELNHTYADLLRQIRGMATNINQMAKVANSTGSLPVLSELQSLGRQIEQYRREGEEQWRSIRSSMIKPTTTEP